MTVGKRVQFDDETWAVVKHGHPVDVKDQLRASFGETAPQRPRRTRKGTAEGA